MTSPGEPNKIDYTRPAGTPGGAPAGGQPPAPGPSGRPPAVSRTGVGWTTYAITILAFVLVLVVVIFIAQNTRKVDIHTFGTIHYVSVAGALAGSAAVGFVAGGLLGLVPQIKLRRELRAYRRQNR